MIDSVLLQKIDKQRWKMPKPIFQPKSAHTCMIAEMRSLLQNNDRDVLAFLVKIVYAKVQCFHNRSLRYLVNDISAGKVMT